MLTYYSTPIPGVGYSFSDLITKEALNLSNQIESTRRSRSPPPSLRRATARLASRQLQHPGRPDLSAHHPDTRGDGGQSPFAVIAYGYVASAVCVLIGPIFIPWFIVPKMDWLFWGWLQGVHRLQLLPGRGLGLYLRLRQSAHFDVPGHRHHQHLERALPSCPRC
jgi:hypothetical protein